MTLIRCLRRILPVLLLPGLLAACAEPASKPAAQAAQDAQPRPAAATQPAEAPEARDALFDGLGKTGQHAALVAALRAGGMVNRLRGAGPFTLFAPVDPAFAALPEGELARLMEPDSKPELVKLLNAHLVTGSLGGGSLAEVVAAGGGRARFATAAGTILTVLPAGDGGFLVVDDAGAQARIVGADLPMTNGTVHAIDRVLRP